MIGLQFVLTRYGEAMGGTKKAEQCWEEIGKWLGISNTETEDLQKRLGMCGRAAVWFLK